MSSTISGPATARFDRGRSPIDVADSVTWSKASRRKARGRAAELRTQDAILRSLSDYDLDEAVAAPAGAGDHHSIHQFLTVVFQGPTHDAFLASLDDPFYEPSDRLLVKRGDLIVSHAHVTKRVMHLAGLEFPVAGLSWLGTLPELRNQGHAGTLVRLAEGRMAADKAVLGFLKTRIPHFFRREDWAVCGRHSHSRAATREVLAELSNEAVAPRASGSAAPAAPQGETLTVRPWRQVELPALQRLYAQNTAGASGPLARSEAYWRWLISRKAFDQIFVASYGGNDLDLVEQDAAIFGYVVTKDDEVLELMADANHPDVAPALLARACAEAIERDLNAITYHGPPGDPMHALFQAARGTQHFQEAHQGEVFMVKLFDPIGFVRSLCGVLHARAEAAGLARPCELGLVIEGRRDRLVLSRRSVKIGRNKTGRSYLSCNLTEFTRLVMGHLDLDEAIAAGRLEASTRLALDTARALFPRLPLWRSPLDDLMNV